MNDARVGLSCVMLVLLTWLSCVNAGWIVSPSDSNSAGSIAAGGPTVAWNALPNQRDANNPASAPARFWEFPFVTGPVTAGDVRLNRFNKGTSDVIRFTDRNSPVDTPVRAHPGSLSTSDILSTVYNPSNTSALPMVQLSAKPWLQGSTVFSSTGFFWYSGRTNSANLYTPFSPPAGVPTSPSQTPWTTVTLGVGVVTYTPTNANQPGYIQNSGGVTYTFSLPNNQCSINNGGCDTSPTGVCTCSGAGCTVPMCSCAPSAPVTVAGFPAVPYTLGPWNGLASSVCVGYTFACSTNPHSPVGCHPSPQLYCNVVGGTQFGTCRVNACLELACPTGYTCKNVGDTASCCKNGASC